MVAYVIIEVEVHDIADYIGYRQKMAPLLESAGARYLARGGEFRVYEGDDEPGRLIILEFPSLETMDEFYESAEYLALRPQREACSRCRILAVQGISAPLVETRTALKTDSDQF